MTRIAPETVVGRFTVSHEIGIGYHDCACCGNVLLGKPADHGEDL